MVAHSTMLTRREWEVIELFARGQRQSDVAEALVISPDTVHVHAANIRRKLGACNAAHAVYLALVQPTITCG